MTGDDNNYLNLWSFQGNTPILQYSGFNSDVTSAAFSYGDERFVFAGSQAGTIVVWDIEAQKGMLVLFIITLFLKLR